MQLLHGTQEDHLGTLRRAKENEIDYIWSGDVRRNPYLAENINFGIEEGIIQADYEELEQESGWLITWLKDF